MSSIPPVGPPFGASVGPPSGPPHGQPNGIFPGQPNGPFPGQPNGPFPGQPNGPHPGPVAMPSKRAVRLLSAGMLVFVLVGAVLAARWAQDVVAPFLNEGEAPMAETIVFDSNGGSYRVVTSGPARPGENLVVCDIAKSDGSTEQVFEGSGSIAPVERLGVSRVVGFDAPAGETSLRCYNELQPSSHSGRFQVVEDDGIVGIAVLLGLFVGALAVLALVLWLIRLVTGGARRQAVT